MPENPQLEAPLASAPIREFTLRQPRLRFASCRSAAGAFFVLLLSWTVVFPQAPQTLDHATSRLSPSTVRNSRSSEHPPPLPGFRRTSSEPSADTEQVSAASDPSSTAPWQPLGPAAVLTPSYGLVSGRVSSLALDPSDATGNTLFVGTTGGGVWRAVNAGTSSAANVAFTPLTDRPDGLVNAHSGALSIGALSVQPGGTGVVLAGTGDPNDALDSYYGAGVLRSTDGGTTWSLIQYTADQNWAFNGEAFSGFAWSTVSPQLVVAAVSQAWEGVIVGALRSGFSYEGLYYSTDAGATWSLARIADPGASADIQGPSDVFVGADGNGATAVVWNPFRRLFIAAVRFHGYYQSSDGINWTRLAAQPGAGLTGALCPANPLSTGSPACPMYRGALAVNPATGDTFAWTVDLYGQDQGIWQDLCGASSGSCSNPTVTFAKRWNTAALETATSLGKATIANGDYNLALAALPSGQDTILLAGGNDLWQCSLAMSCAWRNTTNAFTCRSAGVAPYQHALAFSASNPLEVFIGNDGGLWRSTDGIGETGSVCASADAAHFQNLNGALGSLAEVQSMSGVTTSPYTMMAGLGPNGVAASDGTVDPAAQWPQILGGEGGPVAVDPSNPSRWYVNNGAGVSIHLCTGGGACTSAGFGQSPAISNADVGNDGLTMTVPARFLVDPLDPSQLLVGTCRIWRGPSTGGWTSANAISPMFDGNRQNSSCSGNALIQSMAALPLAGGGEVVYAATYGYANGGGSLPGHVFRATLSPAGVWSAWQDLTRNPVTNDSLSFNAYGLGVSSLTLDPYDTAGNTVYATIAGIPNTYQLVRVVFRSTDGGAHWALLKSNLPGGAPANSVAIDPRDHNTVYLALDNGVYFTNDVSSCATPAFNCWSAFGAGLPLSPVVALSAAPASVSPNVLVAGTYGRGLWQIPLAAAGTQLTTATVSTTSLDFGHQAVDTLSSPQSVSVINTGALGLALGQITATGDFAESDACSNSTLNAGSACTVTVTFIPTATGVRSGQLTMRANIAGSALTVSLSGTGDPPGVVTLTPPLLNFGMVPVGTASVPFPITANNASSSPMPVSSLTATAPFTVVNNTCGASSLPANSSCQILLGFQPTHSGAFTGTLTMLDTAGTQTVQLSGTGAPRTDTLSANTLAFPPTIAGQSSTALNLSLTNSGDVALTNIAVGITGPFQTSNNCTTQLPAHSSCAIAVAFAPTQAGPATGTLTVSDILNAAQTVALSGTALQPPGFTLTPAALSFSAQSVGVASSPQTLTVANTGGAPMANVGFAITGPSSASFSLVTTTCGSTLANGSNCTAQIVFNPVSSGGAIATLAVSSSTPGVKPVSLALTGNGLGTAGLTVSPIQLTFSPQPVGQPSAAQIITLSNTTDVAATGLTFSTSGPFLLTANTCAVSLPTAATCTLSIAFSPSATGQASGALTMTAANLPTPATVALSGIGGLAGAVQITPSPLTFPMTGIGAASASSTVTIANVSAASPLADVALAVSAEFKILSTTCSGALSPGATCTAAVNFSPSSAGPRTGTLSFSSSTLLAAASDALTGIGYDFQAVPSGGTNQTVVSGQTARYAIILSTTVPAAAQFTFQCGPLPAYAACVFNPPTATIPSGATGTEAIQITTAASQASAQALPIPWKWSMLPLALCLFSFPWRRSRRMSAWFTMLVLALGVASCTSSGGGSSGSTPPASTTHTSPPGTYTVPITITSNGVQHTVTLTLVVN